jgi:pyrrolidone-carboxylate peptidase
MSKDKYPFLLFAFEALFPVLDQETRKNIFRLESSSKAINQLLDHLEQQQQQPKYIIGCGIYSGMDQSKIRIETRCSNQFRNRTPGTEYEVFEIKPFVKLNENMKYGYTMGNSWCNLVSFKIISLIKQQKLKSQYTFLHIPKSMPVPTIVSYMRKQWQLAFPTRFD